MSRQVGQFRQVLGRFLIIWVPAMLLLAGGLAALHSIEVASKEALLRSREQAVIHEALQALDVRLTMPQRDVLYLAAQPRLRDLVASGLASERQKLAVDYAAFVASRAQFYDQVRYLDEQGRELVRVNNVGGVPRIVAAQALQDKVDRYYVRDTLALPVGAVYTSPFDLNVENGEVERPRKPMIRFATRVIDGQGRAAGLVVLNYLGQTLIERLRQIDRTEGVSLWLVNGRGDWLLGPRAEDEWGFMFPDKPAATLPSQYPALWQAMQAGGERGQILFEGGILTHATYVPAQAGMSEQGSVPADHQARWRVVAYVPSAALAAQTTRLTRSYGVAYALLGLIFAAGAAGISLLGLGRRRAEAAIRASEARFRSLLEAAPDGIVVSDGEGRIVLLNAQAEKLFGYPREEMLGRPVEMLMPERFRGRHVDHRAAFMDSPGVREMGAGWKLFGLRKDGTEFPVSISLNTIEADGGRLVLSDLRDISIQRSYEAQVNAQNAALASLNRELEAFSYSVSHDLRAPLRSVDGFSQILLEDHAAQLDPEGRAYLNRIRAATQRMAQLIDDMLTLSRVSRAEMHREEVDLSAMAEELLDGLRRAEPARDVATAVAPGLVAQGDPRLLRIALANLLGNAWKFTGRAPGARIEFGREAIDGGVAFFVRDTGAGFDMAYVDKLFRAFQRLHAASDFPGTGIGLAIVQRVIHKHGGRVWAEGEEGKGAVFHFTLPS